MMNLTRSLSVLSLGLVVLFGCSDGVADPLDPRNQLADNAPFVRVSREALGTVDAGLATDVTNGNETFYLAINKAELGQRWFLTAFLKQWHPVTNVPMRTLGTRVVSFKVQNGKLFVFDVADGKGWSETLDPTVLVEAYPIVTTDAAFNAMPGASNYVLFDPAAGLNRFDFVGDSFARDYQVRFQVDLAYLQRFKALSDGVSYEQVFTGYTEVPGPGILGFDQPFRGSGTLAVALRRYSESPGFVSRELPSNHYFGSSNVKLVPNEARTTQNALKWNIAPGMAPIPWRISKEVNGFTQDPRLAGVDVYGAISRGVTGWNTAFGYPVFSVVTAGPDDAIGDDDKNFIIVDRNPAAGLAFADFRENPNTGELRGASVYFSAAFVEGALWSAGDAGIVAVPDAGAPVVSDAGAPAVTDAGAPVVVDAGVPAVVDAGAPVVVDAGILDAGPAPLLPGDVCSLAQPLGVGVTTGSLAGYAANLTTSTAAPCTNLAQPGPDRVYAITVPAGKALTIDAAIVAGANTNLDIALTVLDPVECSVADAFAQLASCLAGADRTGMGAAEHVEWTNAGASARTVNIIIDTYFTNPAVTNATYSLDVRFVDPSTLDAGVVAPDAGAPVVDAGPATVACTPSVTISQAFGGNGASYARDFVELHNRSASAVTLNGWSLQYASANGTSWQSVLLNGTIAPGGFFLVGFAGNTDGGAGTFADQASSINLAATAGKLALVASSTALTGACPTGAQVVDFVGYGATACAEGSAAPAPSSVASVTRKDAAACADSNNNALDFVNGAPAPRSSASPAQACTCVGLAPVTTSDAGVTVTPATPVLGLDGGLLLVAQRPTAAVVPNLSWNSMSSGQTCATHNPAMATIPQGMTRREFIENVITHTVMHEIGHTLGLRHNFKGSLSNSSVMDYLRDEDGSLLVVPGPYDVDAVKYLYGQSPNAPAQPFCTDEDRFLDAECDLFDLGATPLPNDIKPIWQGKVRDFLAGTGTISYDDIFRVSRYVRGAANEAQRLEAFEVLMGDLAPPLRTDLIALSPDATLRADMLATMLMVHLFIDPAQYRGDITADVPMRDPAFSARLIAVTKGMLTNSDAHRALGYRGFDIDVLKGMQTYEAYQALLEARAALVTERATYNALGQAVIDDLIKRLDVACTPYMR